MWLFLTICLLMTGGVIFAGWAIAESMELHRSFDAVVRDATVKAIEDQLPAAVAKAMRKVSGLDLPDNAPLTPYQFVVRIQRRLYQMGAAKDYATAAGPRVPQEFLTDEKVSFGHPDYAWTGSGAVEIADAYEVDHWERKA